MALDALALLVMAGAGFAAGWGIRNKKAKDDQAKIFKEMHERLARMGKRGKEGKEGESPSPSDEFDGYY